MIGMVVQIYNYYYFSQKGDQMCWLLTLKIILKNQIITVDIKCFSILCIIYQNVSF